MNAVVSGSIKPPDKNEWNSEEIVLLNNELSKLSPLTPKDKRTLPRVPVCWQKKPKLETPPDSANCHSFITWYLQSNYEPAAIPPSFFHRILLLHELDLSGTNIKSLPKSLPKLVALKKLYLRRCRLFMELSPQIGELKNLEELHLNETQIMDLPAEIGEIVKLRRLRVSFYGHGSKKKLQPNTLVLPQTISKLSQLIELSIDVDPADKRWDDSVGIVVKELCELKVLKSLSLYLPKVQLLDDFKSNGKSLVYPSLSHFRFIVGYENRRIISRVPPEIEARFRNGEKCLKFVNGGDIPAELKEVLNCSTSFFLDRHATAVNLSQFGIDNMKMLEFCFLAECNMMETIIDVERNHPSSAKHVLESLQYLSIYYMNNLGSIWKGPVQYCCFSKLKYLALHTCPQLTTIFPLALLENLVNLEELILEDCPRVTSLISHASGSPLMSDYLLPSLKRLLLLYLPELVRVCNGLFIAPKLEVIGFYCCPKLKNISKRELSNKNLEKIWGETQWWADMAWDETEWGTGLDRIMRIFSPISKNQDVMTQLVEDRNISEASIQVEERLGKVVITNSNPKEKISDSAPIDGWRSSNSYSAVTGTEKLFASDKIKKEKLQSRCSLNQYSTITETGPQKLKLFASDRIRNEKLRRQGIKGLVSSLGSLLPLEHIKGKRSIQDIVAGATSYIKRLTKRMDELCAARDGLKKLPSGIVDPKMSCNDYNSNRFLEIRKNSDGVDVILCHGTKGRGFTISRVLELLLDEGLDVVTCCSTKLDGQWIHNIGSKVCYPKCFDVSVLQKKLYAQVS